MLSISRRTGTPDKPRRSRGAFAASVALNALLIGVFLKGVADGLRWTQWFDRDTQPVAVERVTYAQAPRALGAPNPGRSGGDGRPVDPRPTRTPPPPAPPAPTAVPETIAPPDPAPVPAPSGGSGPVIGTGGAAQGIQPSYTDGRLWGPTAPSKAPILSREASRQRMDSVIAQTFGAVRDSMLAEQEALEGQRKPGDWTMNGPGGKWGIDQKSIHLGKITIPNAILALLSSNVQEQLRGNPTEISENRRLANVRADLLQHAQREQNEDMFRNAVKEIRARKDRERAARLAEQKARGGEPDRP